MLYMNTGASKKSSNLPRLAIDRWQIKQYMEQTYILVIKQSRHGEFWVLRYCLVCSITCSECPFGSAGSVRNQAVPLLEAILPFTPKPTHNKQWYSKSSHTGVRRALFTLKKTASSYSPIESKNCMQLNVKETRPISVSQTVFDTLLSKKQQNPIVSQLDMDHLVAIWTSRFYCTCERYFTVRSLYSQCFFIGWGWREHKFFKEKAKQ